MAFRRRSVFRNIGDDPDPQTTVMRSLCMDCFGSGWTRMLLTKIPYYKEVVLMSFECDICGFKNNEIQSGAQIAERGISITLNVSQERDLNRQVVKSDYTSIKILELDFEIPAQSQKGEVTTVEGVLNRSIRGLKQDQDVRSIAFPELAAKLNVIVARLEELKVIKKFTMVVEDISGNAFVENVYAPHSDPDLNITYFIRSQEQNHILGIYTTEEAGGSMLQPVAEDDFTLEDLQSEVMKFPTNCSCCNSPCETNMKVTKIPHFKEVVIMATSCDVCGNRTNEVKSGGGMEPQGVQFEVLVRNRHDLSRDVLKSDTCHLRIPELELEVGPHALGGRFTTVEGLLTAIRDQLSDPQQSHMAGDSQDPESKAKFQEFINKFDLIFEGTLHVTLILDDPAGNSYVQSMAEGPEPDAHLKIMRYARTYDQNEELGLNDMKTENY